MHTGKIGINSESCNPPVVFPVIQRRGNNLNIAIGIGAGVSVAALIVTIALFFFHADHSYLKYTGAVAIGATLFTLMLSVKRHGSEEKCVNKKPLDLKPSENLTVEDKPLGYESALLIIASKLYKFKLSKEFNNNDAEEVLAAITACRENIDQVDKEQVIENLRAILNKDKREKFHIQKEDFANFIKSLCQIDTDQENSCFQVVGLFKDFKSDLGRHSFPHIQTFENIMKRQLELEKLARPKSER